MRRKTRHAVLLSVLAWTCVQTASYAADGLEWCSYVGAGGDDWIMTMGTDASGAVTVAGMTTPSVGGPFPMVNGYDMDPDPDWRDGCLARLSADGTTLEWSTFLGGHAGPDWIYDMVVDETGIVTVTGVTYSSDFPTTPGAYQAAHGGGADAFVARLDPSRSPAGDQLVWATLLGSMAHDRGVDLDVDGDGLVTVTGYTSSFDFPTTEGAYDRTLAGSHDVFVSRFDPSETGDAQLVWSTFLGGSGLEGWGSVLTNPINGDVMAVDVHPVTGDVYLAGYTASADFPTTAGAYDRDYNGSRDAFVCRLGADGSSLDWSTYLGGSGEEGAIAVAVDAAGVVTAAGFTYSLAFPTSPGAVDTECGTTGPARDDVFVVRLDPGRPGPDQLVYSTCLGGAGWDAAIDMVLHESGVVTVTGFAGADFPTTPGAWQPSHGGADDGFLCRLRPDPGATDNLLYSTYFGSTNVDWSMAVAAAGPGDADDVLIGGSTYSTDLATEGAFDTTWDGGPEQWPDDGYVARLDLCPIDFDDNGVVDTVDFLALLSAWGPCADPCPPSCAADLNGDCAVDTTDFLILLANWGTCD